MGPSCTRERWSDSTTWTDDGVSREVFFFESGREELFASLYASTRPKKRRAGLVICASWGIEAHRMGTLAEALAHKAANHRGAALVFHYPGFGDSSGRPESITMEDLVAAAVDASVEARSRQPRLAWGFAGIRLGAYVAARARRRTGAGHLLLVQPVFDPARYFAEMLDKSRRATLGRANRGFAFGYPIPRAILSSASPLTRDELGDLAGAEAVSVEYEASGDTEHALEGFDRITVSGTWRFGEKRYPTLKRGSIEALRQLMKSEER